MLQYYQVHYIRYNTYDWDSRHSNLGLTYEMLPTAFVFSFTNERWFLEYFPAIKCHLAFGLYSFFFFLTAVVWYKVKLFFYFKERKTEAQGSKHLSPLLYFYKKGASLTQSELENFNLRPHSLINDWLPCHWHFGGLDQESIFPIFCFSE